MPEKKIRVKPGRLFVVKNRNKHMAANAEYIHTHLEGEAGPVPYMFTHTEMQNARKRAEKNSEDVLKLSRWWRFWR